VELHEEDPLASPVLCDFEQIATPLNPERAAISGVTSVRLISAIESTSISPGGSR
jgi:hypothetical protein